jgi:hypothetical protein
MMALKIYCYQKMSDAFENRIREKLNEADPPFDQGAWNNMEQLLNASSSHPDNNSGAWWLLLLLLLSVGGAVGYWSHITEMTTPTLATITTALPMEKVMPDATVITTSQSKETLAAIPPKLITASSSLHQNKEYPTSSKDKTTIENSTSENEKEMVAIMKKEHAGVGMELLKTKQVPATVVPAILNNSTPVLEQVNEGTEKGDSGRLPVRNRLSFGLTLGPDFNVAPSMKYGKVGLNAGVLLHYAVNSHWSFTTGAVYNKKTYGATPADYAKLPPTYPGYAITKVDAVCSVLDVPVNANYTFWQQRQNTLSGTLGWSNYFMLREKYDYYYSSAPEKVVEFSNKNQHYMAILNVALTWQHPLGKHLSLGIQPYAKIPLKGVGYGGVRLYSTGVALQVNFSGVKF